MSKLDWSKRPEYKQKLVNAGVLDKFEDNILNPNFQSIVARGIVPIELIDEEQLLFFWDRLMNDSVFDNDFSLFINAAFGWRFTPDGYEFWENISNL